MRIVMVPRPWYVSCNYLIDPFLMVMDRAM